MKTYTYGTTPSVVIHKLLPRKYPMELNKEDMAMLLEALYGHDTDRSRDLRMSILETIGIEEL